MSFYTVVFEYRGGTYGSQVHAADEHEAFVYWASQLRFDEIQYFDENLKTQLMNDTKDDEHQPILLSGLNRVWCATFSLHL